MGKIMGILIVMLSEAIILFLVSLFVTLNMDYIDILFFGGVVFIVITFFFSSEGGFLSKNADVILGRMGLMTKDMKEPKVSSYRVNIFTVGSVLLTLLGLVIDMIRYWSYF